MKSPIVKLGIWSLCLLMSGGCGSMQNAYENYLRDEILNRGQWTMTVDASPENRSSTWRSRMNLRRNGHRCRPSSPPKSSASASTIDDMPKK